jgi:acetyl esterase/lipase
LLGHAGGGPDVSQYAAPARGADLSNLPPAYLDTGSSEVFRDEIMDYASRLVQAGTMVELHVWSGAMHGPERMAPDAEVSLAGIAARKSYLRRAVRTI